MELCYIRNRKKQDATHDLTSMFHPRSTIGGYCSICDSYGKEFVVQKSETFVHKIFNYSELLGVTAKSRGINSYFK